MKLRPLRPKPFSRALLCDSDVVVRVARGRQGGRREPWGTGGTTEWACAVCVPRPCLHVHETGWQRASLCPGLPVREALHGIYCRTRGSASNSIQPADVECPRSAVDRKNPAQHVDCLHVLHSCPIPRARPHPHISALDPAALHPSLPMHPRRASRPPGVRDLPKAAGDPQGRPAAPGGRRQGLAGGLHSKPGGC